MDNQYLELLRTIKEKGTYKAAARENMPGTYSLFGYQIRHDLSTGFPLLTTKKVYWKGVVTELLWFLKGLTNIKFLIENGSNFWNEDAYNFYLKNCKLTNQNPVSFDDFIEIVRRENDLKSLSREHFTNGYVFGDTGHQYGKLWRAWEKSTGSMYVGEIDQVAELIKGLKENPMGRRHIITAWNPATLDKMALPACHLLVQFNCRPIYYFTGFYETKEDFEKNNREFWENNPNKPRYYLDCKFIMRSTDVFLGLPFNIASYALLTHIIGKICNMLPGDLIIDLGDAHIYENHMSAVNEQLTREPRPLPILAMADAPGEVVRYPYETAIYDFNLFISKVRPSDFRLEGYNPHPVIAAELSTGMKK